MSGSKSVRVLYMEDDRGVARLVQKRLERAGYVVDLAHDGQEGLDMYEAGSYNVVAVDQVMPVYEGLEVIRRLALKGPLPPTIMVTGSGDEMTAVEAMKLGASDYIVKDVEGGYLELLPSVLERAINRQRLVEEKRKAEEALRRYAIELQARNEDLDAFAHTVAHDLKSPLGYIVGFAHVLEEDYDALPAEERRSYLRMIARTGHKMSNIIDELLLLAGVRKIEDMERVPVDVASIVAEALQRLAPMIEEYQAEIVEPDDWPVALGYGPWVEEVWVNYLSNAIKYGGAPPRVELGHGVSGLKLAPQPKGGEEQAEDVIYFWVRDNGPGLAPEEKERLFTLFTRLDQVRAKGHGLGLSIVRRIVEKLGGQVGVESEVGAGSVFWFTLPAAGSR